MPQNKIINPFSSMSNKDPNFLKSDLFQFGIDEGIPRNQNVIQNAGMILQESRTPKNALSPVGLPDLPEPEPESETESMPQDDSQSRFLASLLGQGAAMFGGAIAGRDPMKIAEQFSGERLLQDRMAQAREQEQYTRGERELLKQEQSKIRLANEEQRKLAIEQAKNLMNPDSEESKRKRMIYERALGIKIPGEFSASDLEDRNVLQGLVAQSQPKPIPGRVGGGVSQPKEVKPKDEKEKPSEKKLLSEYTEHARSLQSSINVMDAVRNLNRSPIGRFTPDISTKTKADVGTIDREAQPQVKVLAGPGSVTDSERQAFIQLVTNSNMTRELAEETTKRTVIEGTSKAMAKLKADRDVGLISDSDFNKIINQYNQYLKNPKLGINKEINQDGDIVDIGSIDFNEE